MSNYRVYYTFGKDIPNSMSGTVCFSDAFSILQKDDHIIVGIPLNIDKSNGDDRIYKEISDNKIILPYQDVRKYIFLLKRALGGIYKVKLVKKYSFDKKFSIDGLFLFIDKNTVKTSNQYYGIRVLLTAIRYIFEENYRDILFKAMSIYKSKEFDLDILSLLLNCHINNFSIGHGHSLTKRYCSYAYINGKPLPRNALKNNNPFVRFDRKRIVYREVQLNNENMPVIKNLKLKQRIYDKVTK